MGAVIRAVREHRGVSLRDFAGRIEVSPATLSGIETGATSLSVDRLCRIADELDVDPGRLLTGDAADVVPDESNGAVSGGAAQWREFPDLPMDPALSGALAAFCETGYHGASIRDIAQHAGLSVAGLYHYHPSKQAMLPALMELTMTDLDWRLAAALDEGGAPGDRLHRAVECLALFHARRPQLAFLGASEMRSLEPADRHRITGRRKRVQRIVEECVAAVRGGDPTDPDVIVVGNAVTTMCTSVAQWFRPDGALDPHTVATDYADMALAMARRPPSTSSRKDER